MQQVYRFGPAPKQPARHLFVFLHASGADARSMIPAAFKYQGRFPSAALVVPSGFARYGKDVRSASRGQQWFSTKDLTDDNRMARVSAILPVYFARTAARTMPAHEATALWGYASAAALALTALVLARRRQGT